MSDDLWQRGCTQLAAELPEQQFNTWIRPLPPGEVSAVCDATGSTVVSLRVPNRFKLDWIRSQYAARIEGVLSGLAGKPVRLDLQLAPREATPAAPAPPIAVGAALNGTMLKSPLLAALTPENLPPLIFCAIRKNFVLHPRLRDAPNTSITFLSAVHTLRNIAKTPPS